MTTNRRARRFRLLAIFAVFAIIVAACGDDDDEPAADDASASASDSASASEPEESDDAEEEAAPEETEDAAEEDATGTGQIAYLSASSANTWLQSSRASMDAVAAEAGLEIVEFDAQFDAALQQTQFQDAIASGQYDGIVLVSLTGAGSIPDVEDALDAGLEVVVLNQVVGEDLTTVEPQVDGIAAAVFEPPLIRGERIGDLTLQACEDRDPCNVVYFYGIRGVPLDEAVRAGWDSVVEGSAVTVVAEAEGQYLGPDVGLAAMQDILVTTQDIDVVVGADQSMQGVELALDDAPIDDLRIIGFGGSSYAVDAIADGRWWGGLYGAPGTEGTLAMEAMVAALAGTDTGGVDPALSVPNGGLMTPDNIADFSAEWDG
ncbi:MAG: sugar ABC transporter substrate-binding protein [Actinomycetota bacterium]